MDLYFDKEVSKYVSLGAKCDNCDKSICDVFIRYALHKSKKVVELSYCRECYPQMRKLVEYGTWKKAMVAVVKVLGPLAVPVVEFGKLDLKPSSLTCFEAAVREDDAKVIDRTKYALRDSWEGASIGADVATELERLDAPVSTKEGLKLLDDLRKAQ